MKRINRREVLRGACGITLGLPFLEAMGSRRSIGKVPVRTAYFFMANGVGPNSMWNPKKKGKGYDVHSSMLPLSPVKHFVNVHSGLNGPAGGHPSGASALLTGRAVAIPDKLKVKGISIDQIIAKEIGENCYLPSLELSLDKPKSGLSTDKKNLAYGSYLSWSSPNTPIPRELNPHNAFNRLFKDLKQSSGRGDYSKSVLDYVKDDAGRLKRILGTEDNRKIDQYFYSVRQIERRLEKIGKSTAQLPAGTKAPGEGMRDRWEKARAMIDIIVLAFQTDRTRVASMMLEHGGSGERYKFLPGVTEGHHKHSHHGNKKVHLNALNEINKFLLSFYVEMIKQMSVIQEENGTLLDNSQILFTSCFKDGQKHTRNDLPVLLAGGGGGTIKTGYHHDHKGKHLNSLLLGMAKTAGCKISSFAGVNNAVI